MSTPTDAASELNGSMTSVEQEIAEWNGTDRSKDVANVSGERLQCSTCKKTFAEKRSLNRHVLHQHSDGRPQHPCGQCGKIFSRNHSLLQHMRIQHGHEVSYPCRHCDEVFNWKDSLQEHMQMQHLTHPCKHCGKVYKEKRSLTQHVQFQHTGDYVSHPCNHCEKIFKRKDLLMQHVRFMHTGDFIPHPCKLCGKVFKEKRSLTQHVQFVHTGEFIPHPCKLCQKVFKERRKLLSHVKNLHQGNPQTCRQCGDVLKDKASLLEHMDQQHPYKTGPHPCGHCGSILKNKDSLRKHMSRQHLSDSHQGLPGERALRHERSLRSRKRKCHISSESSEDDEEMEETALDDSFSEGTVESDSHLTEESPEESQLENHSQDIVRCREINNLGETTVLEEEKAATSDEEQCVDDQDGQESNTVKCEPADKREVSQSKPPKWLKRDQIQRHSEFLKSLLLVGSLQEVRRLVEKGKNYQLRTLVTLLASLVMKKVPGVSDDLYRTYRRSKKNKLLRANFGRWSRVQRFFKLGLQHWRCVLDEVAPVIQPSVAVFFREDAGSALGSSIANLIRNDRKLLSSYIKIVKLEDENLLYSKSST